LANPKQADSKREREAVLEWWDGTMETRGAAADINRARVVIGQRLHERDIPGHIMANDVDNEWARLIIPMRFESGRMPDIGIGSDPRKKHGELMDPVRFPEAVVKRTERRLGPHGTAGQLQQRPTSKDSEKFKLDQITFVEPDAVPFGKIARYKRFWDRAGTSKGGDYSVGTLAGIIAGPVPKVFVLDQVRGQWSVDQVVAQMGLWARLDQQRFGFSKMETLFERGLSDAGIQAARDTIRRMPGRRVRSIRPTGSKEVRAEPLANAIAAGEVYFVIGAWNQDCVDEMRTFPRGANDDCVDSLSGVYSALTGGSIFEEGIDSDDDGAERFVRCANPKCNRYACSDLDHCCECCLNAEAEGRTLGEADHSGECAYRHSQLVASGDWSPSDARD
jgi:predicted phage terminase large subunit-like protein